MLPRSGNARVALILLLLLISICAPVVAEGYSCLDRARAAENHGEDPASAATNYACAARLLPWKPELREKAGAASASLGDWATAAHLLEAARGRGALSANGWRLLGEAYWAQHDYQKSSEVWSSGLRQYPGNVEFYSRLGLAYRILGQFGSEQQALEQWIPAGRASASEHYRLGQLLMPTDPQRALQELGTAASMDSAFGPAVETLRASITMAASEPDRGRQLVLFGRALGLVQDWSLAAGLFQQATVADRLNGEAWAWLGEAQQQAGIDGRSALNRAVSLAPRDTVVLALRGLYWRRTGQYAGAIREYQAAAQIEPNNAQWQASLAEAYDLHGDLVSALASYQAATRLEPQSASYWRLLAMFCADNAVRVVDVGLPAARKALELAPNDPQAADVLGWSYAQAGLLYGAEQQLIKVTSESPNFALAHLHLAETELRVGNAAAALRELTLARKLDEDGAVGALANQLLQQYFP